MKLQVPKTGHCKYSFVRASSVFSTIFILISERAGFTACYIHKTNLIDLHEDLREIVLVKWTFHVQKWSCVDIINANESEIECNGNNNKTMKEMEYFDVVLGNKCMQMSGRFCKQSLLTNFYSRASFKQTLFQDLPLVFFSTSKFAFFSLGVSQHVCLLQVQVWDLFIFQEV